MEPNNIVGVEGQEHKVHARIKKRLWMYLIISIILLGISIFHIIEDKTNFVAPIVSFVIGLTFGTFLSRMYKITWDHGAKQVISRFDVFGILILFGYIYFEINRDEIVEHFVHGPAVVAVSFALLSGIMYGRVLGIRGKIKQVFREQEIID